MNSQPAVSPSIFEFNSPQEYLAAYFDWRQKNDNTFSLESCLQGTTFSLDHLEALVSGERRFSEDSLAFVLDLIGLKGRERSFFLFLVSSSDQGIDFKVVRNSTDYVFTPEMLIDMTVLELIPLAPKQYDLTWYEKVSHGFVSSDEVFAAIRRLIERGELVEKNGQLEVREIDRQKMKNEIADAEAMQKIVTEEFTRLMRAPKLDAINDICTLNRSDIRDFILDFLDLMNRYQTKSPKNDARSVVGIGLLVKQIFTYRPDDDHNATHKPE